MAFDMTLAARLDKAVKKIMPDIHGVSIEDQDDKKTWTVQFGDKEPSKKQKAEIDKVIKNMKKVV